MSAPANPNEAIFFVNCTKGDGNFRQALAYYKDASNSTGQQPDDFVYISPDGTIAKIFVGRPQSKWPLPLKSLPRRRKFVILLHMLSAILAYIFGPGTDHAAGFSFNIDTQAFNAPAGTQVGTSENHSNFYPVFRNSGEFIVVNNDGYTLNKLFSAEHPIKKPNEK
jgi:hypothetical protein